jgi:K+-sensing histidine kinase KdpD
VSNETPELDFTTVLASTVHDMKNSLSMLLGTLDQLKDQCTKDGCSAQNKLLQMQYEGRRVNGNLIQLLALYRIQNAQYFANISEYDVGEFLEENMVEHEDLLAPRGIKFAMSCPEDLVWFFDRELVSGVITNVINNAQKYTKDQLILSAGITNGFLAIHVEDNGKGYPEQMLHGSQGKHAALNFGTGSTGLGLYFASTVAQLHKNKDRSGYIVTSNDGIDGGGRFTICLP